MSNLGKTFGLLLGVVMIGVLGWAVWLGLEYVGALFATLDPQVAKVTAIGAAAVLVAAAIIASAVRKGGARSQAARVQEQKLGAYQFLVECWQDEGAAPHKLFALDRLLALYGGAGVIRAHVALRAIAREKGARHPDTTSQLGKVLLEIRKELGTGAQGITALGLQQLVISAPAPSAAHAGSGSR